MLRINKLLTILLVSLISIFLMSASVFALSIDIFETAPANLVMVEDFEGFSFDEDGQWYQELTTDVGTFYANGSIGLGDTSYNADPSNTDSTDPYFLSEVHPGMAVATRLLMDPTGSIPETLHNWI